MEKAWQAHSVSGATNSNKGCQQMIMYVCFWLHTGVKISHFKELAMPNRESNQGEYIYNNWFNVFYLTHVVTFNCLGKHLYAY